ncbi:MAG: hypothetical protein SFU98_10795 [Leptospiraceae bacterium]|nr:hypothetical protein [Leptospiraceae bacterium]
MNQDKLKTAERKFLTKYPLGFQSPEMLEIVKKHKMEKYIEFAKTSFAKENLKQPKQVTQAMVKMITQSSMVSVFEKPKFRDFVASLSAAENERLGAALMEFLHGDEKSGFENQIQILTKGQLAKWSIITVCPSYFEPNKEVFIKPTTAKGVIEHFEITKIKYNPKPTYEFYKEYRAIINSMKKKVNKSLSPSNAAFGGFLMMSLGLYNK